MRTRTLGKASATTALAAMTVFGVAAPALAAGGTVQFNGSNINVRSCAYLSCGVVGQGNYPTKVNSPCYTLGEDIVIGGSHDNSWFKVTAGNGAVGYSNGHYISIISGTIPRC